MCFASLRICEALPRKNVAQFLNLISVISFLGPDEELSRKLSCLDFVMHAPSNYYLDRTTPFPLPDEMDFDTKPGGYIWTTLPEYHRNKSTVEV